HALDGEPAGGGVRPRGRAPRAGEGGRRPRPAVSGVARGGARRPGRRGLLGAGPGPRVRAPGATPRAASSSAARGVAPTTTTPDAPASAPPVHAALALV